MDKMVKVLFFFCSFFSLLSHHFILFFSPLSFFLIHSYQPLIFSPFTLFSSHSCCFSLFLSASPHHLLDLMPISIVVVFFFGSDLMGGFGSGWVQMVMGKLMVVGCDGWIQWWVGHLANLSMGCDGDGQISDGEF